MNAEQKDNLHKLIAGCKKILAEQPDYNKFNMSHFLYTNTLSPTRPAYAKATLETHCGTVACFAGHGPLFGITPAADEDWLTYVERAFGIHWRSDDFGWLFDCGWAQIPEEYTLAAAIERAEQFVDNGFKLSPQMQSYMQTHEVTLCL